MSVRIRKPVESLAPLALFAILAGCGHLDATPVEASAVSVDVVYGAGGTGAFPAIAETRSDLEGYTIYHPEHRADESFPVVLWGNGGCRDNGLMHADFLRQVASEGYVVIALGYPREVYKGQRPAPPATPAAPAPEPEDKGDETRLEQVFHGMDWAQALDRSDPLAATMNTDKFAVMGHSCGGLQAIAASADPRIDTSVIFDSGVYNPGMKGPRRSGIQVSKDDLAKIHAPIAYVDGGPGDIAHENNLDDYNRISRVLAFRGELPVGHGGTFWSQPDGGEWALVATHWLDWQLKGRPDAEAWFVGADCGFCTRGDWTVSLKTPSGE